jgi:hypothetical protein
MKSAPAAAVNASIEDRGFGRLTLSLSAGSEAPGLLEVSRMTTLGTEAGGQAGTPGRTRQR